MSKSHIKYNILMCLMDNGIALSQTIKAVLGGTSQVGNYISILTRQGYIKRKDLPIRSNNRKYTIQYISITRQGVQWLIDNYPNDSYIPFLPNPVPRFRITDITNNDTIQKYLKSISASLMFKSIGIETAEQENKKATDTLYFIDMIEKAKRQYSIAQDKPINSTQIANALNTVTRYYHSRTIHDNFTLNQDEVAQYKFSTHIGLLLNCSIPYIIYASNPNGTVFQAKAVERAQLSVSTMLRMQGIGVSNELSNGIVFCKNGREFGKVFNSLKDRMGQDQEQFMDRRLARIFKHLYAVPIQSANLPILKEILTYEDNYRIKIRDKLLSLDSSFQSTYSPITELDYDGTPAYIGTDMDLCRIQYLYRNLSYQKSVNVVIICYPHQQDYYERIMPKDRVSYYILNKK